MVRGPRRPGVPRPPEPMRPKPPGLQPPRFTLVVQRCRRVRYRWRQWAWVPVLAPAVRWLRRSHAAVAAVAVAGPIAVAVWYLPVTGGPRSAEPVPVTAPAQARSAPAAPGTMLTRTSASTIEASHPPSGPSTGEVAASSPASAAASPEATAVATARGVRSLAPALSGLLQGPLSQLPDLGLPTLPAVTLPAVPLPAVPLPAVALPVAQLSGALLSQVNVPQATASQATGSQVTGSQVTVSKVTAGLPVVLGAPRHP